MIPSVSIASMELMVAFGVISNKADSLSLKPVCLEVNALLPRSSVRISAVRPTPELLNSLESFSWMERLVSSGLTVY